MAPNQMSLLSHTNTHTHEFVTILFTSRMFDEYSGEKTHYILKGNHNSERGEEFLTVAKDFLMSRLAPPGRRKVLGEGGVLGNVKLEGYKGGAAHMAVAVGLAMAVASYFVQAVQ